MLMFLGYCGAPDIVRLNLAYRLNTNDENFWTLYSCGKQYRNNHSFCKLYIPLCFTNYENQLSVNLE